jgi:hypothetical protein
MKTFLLKNAREQKGLKLRWHNFWEIDQALSVEFESGTRENQRETKL